MIHNNGYGADQLLTIRTHRENSRNRSQIFSIKKVNWKNIKWTDTKTQNLNNTGKHKHNWIAYREKWKWKRQPGREIDYLHFSGIEHCQKKNRRIFWKKFLQETKPQITHMNFRTLQFKEKRFSKIYKKFGTIVKSYMVEPCIEVSC